MRGWGISSLHFLLIFEKASCMCSCVYVFLCVCVCVCVCTFAYVCTFYLMCGVRRAASGAGPRLLCLKQFSLSLWMPSCPSASADSPVSHLLTEHRVTGSTGLYVGTGDLNSQPHLWTTSVFSLSHLPDPPPHVETKTTEGLPSGQELWSSRRPLCPPISLLCLQLPGEVGFLSAMGELNKT